MNAESSHMPAAFSEQKADIDDLAEIFHENTKYWPSTLAASTVDVLGFLHAPHLINRAARGYNDFPSAGAVALARCVPSGKPFEEVMRARASTRVCADAPVECNVLGGVLDVACRATRIGRTEGGAKIYFRSYPSGGALYPVEIYLVALNVSGLPGGIYHYNPRAHVLAPVREALAPAEFRAALTTPAENENAAAAIILTSVLQRSTAKYGVRGYRFALLEAGHCGQNLCLAAEAAGLSTCLCGGYFDDRLAALCGADGVNEAVVSLMFLGRAQEEGNNG